MEPLKQKILKSLPNKKEVKSEEDLGYNKAIDKAHECVNSILDKMLWDIKGLVYPKDPNKTLRLLISYIKKSENKNK